MPDISYFSSICFWLTFIVTLFTSIGSGLLMVFKHVFLYIVPFAVIYSVMVLMVAHNTGILIKLREQYFVLLTLTEQLGILLFFVTILASQIYLWKKKS